MSRRQNLFSRDGSITYFLILNASVSADVFKTNDHHYCFSIFVNVLIIVNDKNSNVNKEITGAFHIKKVKPK